MTDHPAAIEKATRAVSDARAAQADADRERETAIAAREMLLSRIAKGATGVQGADLTDADQDVRLSDLRCEAAATRVEKAEQALHRAEVDQLRDDVQSLLDGGHRNERMDAHVEKVAEAVVALIGEWRDQTATVDELVQRSVRLEPLPDDLHRDGGTLKFRNRPVGIPGPDALIAALLGHLFDGQGIKVAKDLASGIRHYTGGYAGSVAHRYPLGAVLHPYGTDRIYELTGKQRWTGDE